MKLRVVALLLFVASSLSAQAPLRLGDAVEPLSQQIALRLDPEADAYAASTTIDVNVRKAVREVRLHSLGPVIETVTIDGKRATFETGEQAILTITNGELLDVGRHRIAISFRNDYDRQALGLYKVVKDGEPMLFTQFQAIEARKAFPCFDEPTFKPSWQLTIQSPAQYDVVSNTPVSTETVANGWKTVAFERTGALPAYLIALAVGRFDFTAVPGTSVPTRVITMRGQAPLATVAAKAIPPVLAELEKYFGSRYPFAKLDFIAVPDYWYGAMENPGLITFKDLILLIDETRAAPTQRRTLAQYIAHEVAHMWFGDLVTMEWWDDFWLNESFADWMGDKIVDRVYPELGQQTSQLALIQRTMNNDVAASVSPVRTPGTSPDEAMRNVGTAYYKGKAILSMFERWIGEEKFRQGVLEHIRTNAWDNADANEFWAVLAKHAPKGTDAALRSFIEKPGIPIVTFTRRDDTTMIVSQRRLGSGMNFGEWRIPLVIRYSDGSATRTKRVLLDEESETVAFDGKRVAWLFPTPDATGYFRWQVPPSMLANLTANARNILSPDERLAFLGNAGALLSSGDIHGDQFLAVIEQFANDPDPQAVEAALDEIERLRLAFDTPATRDAFHAFIVRTLRPAMKRIGMTRREGESEAVRVLRPYLIYTLGTVGDEEARAFAKNADLTSLDADILPHVLVLRAIDGDAALFETYRRSFENAKDPVERRRYLWALSAFRQPEVRERALAYSLTGPLEPNEVLMIAQAGGTPELRARSFNWATENFDAIAKRLPESTWPNVVLLAGGCEPETVEKARAFFADPARNVEGVDQALLRVTENVAECVALRNREMEAVQRYLAR